MKIILAYSGGLDTSIILHWLRETYKAEVIAVCVDIGQGDELSGLEERADKLGASKVYIEDLREEFVASYIFPALKANAIYEEKYLLGTALARPLIAKKVMEIAKKENADAVSHGATGKGNDQVRFETGFRVFDPNIKIIAPWREWEIKSREDEIEYAKKYNIEIPVSKEKPYSTDRNLWHISYEGGILEDLSNPPDEDMFILTKSPEKSNPAPTIVEIGFERGIPTKIDGKSYNPVELIERLNLIGGENGIGRIDIVENRLVGIKSRGVYETPGGTILHIAHRELESIILDRETQHYKELLAKKYAELVYYGLWFTPLKEAIDGFVDKTQEKITGSITMRLYKGVCSIIKRESPYSLYKKDLATFGSGIAYNHKDAKGFIKLFGLQYEGMMKDLRF
ncbi:MAG: argininosuccinate synthase [bacterium]